MFILWATRLLLGVSDAKLPEMVPVILGIVFGRDSFDSWLLNKEIPAFVQEVRGCQDVDQSAPTLLFRKVNGIFLSIKQYPRALHVISTKET